MKTTRLLGSALLAAALAFPLSAQDAEDGSDPGAGPFVVNATLSGAEETEGGAADGGGAFHAEMDSSTGDVCYSLTYTGAGAPTAAHIHKGAAGSDGKPVLTLMVTGPDEDDCIAAPHEDLLAIQAEPGNYYVNVHTGAYPKGAARGQLAKQ